MPTHASPPAPDRVLLIGMMGSGKSTVGRALATRTGWPFVDNDELVKRATGRTARELLADAGEATMRDAESAALRLGLATDPPVIIGVAAGVVLDPKERARIASSGGLVVWLVAAAEVLEARAAGASHRPWLDGDAIGWFRRTVSEREPLYHEVADVRIDTAATSPEEAADAILRSLPSTA